MITTQQISEYLENGLNALLDYEGLSFKIWATAGEREKPERTGNAVQQFINGNMRVATSSLTPNILVMGINSFTITFDVPVNPPKTRITQTAEDLSRVRGGQYWFLLYVESVIAAYFQKPKTVQWTDGETTYDSTISAGVGIPADIDLSEWRGNTVPVDVYVEVNLGEGAVPSLSAVVEMDGIAVPYVSFVPERASQADAAQYSNNENTTSLATSSAFVAEIAIPVNTLYSSSPSALSYLFGGALNVAHFLKIDFGGESGVYLVTITRATSGLEMEKLASATFQVAEAVGDFDLLEIPEGFQSGYFELPSSQIASLTLSVSADCLARIAGKAYEMTAGTPLAVTLAPDDIVYDEDSDAYRVYMITSTAVTVTGDYAFEVENG